MCFVDSVVKLFGSPSVIHSYSKLGIDTFYKSSKIQPNMLRPFALPRSRRPQPTSLEKVGSLSFG